MAAPHPRLRALRVLLPLVLGAVWTVQPAAAQIPDPRGGPPVVVAAGDIACDPEDGSFNEGAGTAARCRQQATADTVASLDPDAVLAVGDIQYEDGVAWKFDRSYDPSWGRFKAITYPAAGNHEYFGGDDAAGYFDYFNGVGNFGGRAGDRDKGYYSRRLGSWNLIALNSVCSQAGGCGPGSPQERWLRAELAADRSPCTLAYMHHPVSVSGGLPWPSIQHLWRVMQDAGVDVAVVGHAHHYERFGKLGYTGAPDPERGIRQFIVGTGGKSLSRERDTPLSEAMTTSTFGVLALTLRRDGYDWRFVRESGEAFGDSGSEACQGPPPAEPPEAATGSPGGVRGTAARMTAAVDARNQATTYRFEYGRTPSYGQATSERSLPAEPGRKAVSERITGLRKGRVYHYRVVATSAAGTVAGENRSFRAGRRSRYADTIARTRGLLSHWRLGEGVGGLAFDATGRGVGEYAGGHRLARRGALVRDRDRSAAFDGSTGSVRLDTPVLGSDASIEGWFRWKGGPVLLRDDSSIGGWYIRESRGRLSYRFGGTVFRTRRGITSVQDDAWHHVVVTKHGETVRLFLDGRLVHRGRGIHGPGPTMPWHVMRNGPFAAHSSGRADDIAFYDRALRRSTIRAHYRTGVRRRAPNTLLTAPSGATNDPDPVVRMRSTRRRSKIRCAFRVPGGGRPETTPCPSARRLSGLADGRYKLTAYAVARGGYPDPTPAVTRFRVDTVTPLLDVVLDEPGLREFLRDGLTAEVTCSERCTARARLMLDGATARRLGLSRRGGREVEVGRTARSLGGGRAGSVRLRFPRLRGKPRKRLSRLGRMPIIVRVTASDAAGNARGVRRDLVLRR